MVSARYFVNDNIRANRVLLVDSDNTNLGEHSRHAALEKARSKGLDLVLMSKPNEGTPICKMMDYGKFKYDQSKKANKKKPPAMKEMMFHMRTSEHDMETKTKKVQGFLDKKHKVKFGIYLKGRERNFRSEARAILENSLSAFSGKAKHDGIKESDRLVFVTLSPV